MAGAVVLSRLADDRSMLGAMRHAESLRIDKPAWRNIESARDAAIRRVPDREAYFATRRLLDLLSEARSGGFDWPARVQEAAEDVGKDADNLVARLAYAVLLDMYAVERTSGSATPQRRAQAIREIIDAAPRAAESTFRGERLLQAWNNVLSERFERPDVGASLASQVGNPEALQIVSDRILALRSLLSERGAAQDAEACTRWLVECLAGLMLSETHADTRLLCADLIARAVPVDSKIARDMQALRRAYHDAARRAPLDLCDQASRLSVAPAEYRRALWLLVACLGVAAAAAGAAVCLPALCLIAPIAARLASKRTRATPIERAGWARLPIAVTPAGLGTIALAIQVDRNGLFSPGWAILLCVSMVSVGVLTTILLASFSTARGKGSKRIGRLIPWFVTALFVAIPFIPPALLTRVCRDMDLAVGAWWVVFSVAIGLIVLAKRWAPARMGTIAATAAFVSCLHACLALGLCVWHSAADERYQQAAVKGHADKVAARLGESWRGEYLDALMDAYDVPGERGD